MTFLECGRESKFIRFLERIHEVHSIERETSKGIYRVETNQNSKQLPDLRLCGLKFGSKMRKAAQKRENKEWANEKPKLDKARRTRGIYFIDPEDGE